MAREYTARGNLVAVISNGTAVLGLGDIGPLASKPVMEGKAVLFKKFAGIDVFDLEVDARDIDRFVEVVAAAASAVKAPVMRTTPTTGPARSASPTAAGSASAVIARSAVTDTVRSCARSRRAAKPASVGKTTMPTAVPSTVCGICDRTHAYW